MAEYVGKHYAIESQPVGLCPGRRPLVGFTVQEYQGFEVYRLTSALAVRNDAEIYDERYWPRGPDGLPTYHVPIREPDGLPLGALVVWKESPVDCIWARGWVEESGSAPCRERIVRGDYAAGSLAFASDDRGCWIVTCVWNNAALGRVQF